MGALNEQDLARRLAALADDAPPAALAGRSVLARRRAAAVQRRRTVLTGAGLAAAVVLVAPLPALLRDTGPAPLAGEREVATFSFPDTAAVAEVLEVPADPGDGRRVRVVVRVRSERGPVGRVDLTWGDGRTDRLDGGARCTPGAGPTTLDLPAEHVYDAPGLYTVRAVPRVLLGCEQGVRRFAGRGGEAGQAGVEVR